MPLSEAHYQQLPLEGPRHVVVADGELDVRSAAQLAAALDEPIESGKTHVVLDMSTVRFVDSMVVHVLVGAARELRQRFGRLAIVCADPNVRRQMEITRLDVVALLFDSREAALRGLLDL
jgi:anti-sigma B factor antagonist